MPSSDLERKILDDPQPWDCRANSQPTTGDKLDVIVRMLDRIESRLNQVVNQLPTTEVSR